MRNEHLLESKNRRFVLRQPTLMEMPMNDDIFTKHFKLNVGKIQKLFILTSPCKHDFC